MKNSNKNEYTIFGITCRIVVIDKIIGIHSIEFGKNFISSFSKHNILEEMLSRQGTRIFLNAFVLKQYNYDLEKMFNDKDFMENVLIQVTDGETNSYDKIIINNIETLKSVEKVIRKKASKEVVIDSIFN